MHYSLEMEALGGGRAGEKMRMCEKLGDLCCLIKACPAAIKFYEQQVSTCGSLTLSAGSFVILYISHLLPLFLTLSLFHTHLITHDD